ncbi:MAG TPA: cell division protein FtsZ, partial [Microbacterium sp.]|nr:cell division protein FtsZ [Microbacterium sp.]
PVEQRAAADSEDEPQRPEQLAPVPSISDAAFDSAFGDDDLDIPDFLK